MTGIDPLRTLGHGLWSPHAEEVSDCSFAYFGRCMFIAFTAAAAAPTRRNNNWWHKCSL
jgi:hypothetical protein